jgi:glycosyltransferase involved in cell wall biosynthesis
MNELYLSVIIPIFNEEKRLSKTFSSLESYFLNKKYNYEVIFVSDGSGDKTKEIVKDYIKNKQNYKLLDYPINKGKGFAVKEGMLNANGEYLLFTDADFSTPLIELDKLLPKINKFGVVIGSRYINPNSIKIKQPFIRRFVSRGGNLLTRLITGLPYFDTQCGFKLFQNESAKKIFSRMTINRWGFDIEILAVAKYLNITVKEVSVDWYDDTGSKLRAGRDGLNTLKELFNIKLNIINKKYK